MMTCNSHLKDKVPAELNLQMMSKLKYHQKIKRLVGVIPLVLLYLLAQKRSYLLGDKIC